jgi:hypothetical protein
MAILGLLLRMGQVCYHDEEATIINMCCCSRLHQNTKSYGQLDDSALQIFSGVLLSSSKFLFSES